MDPLADLLLAFRTRGDVHALGDLFDRTAPRLLRLAMHLVSHTADAEDLVQQTFVLAMQKAGSFDERQPLMPWLCGILAGEARNLVRKQRRNQAEALPELGAADREPPVAAEHAELVAQLRAHVEELPGEQRQVLLMQLQHGLSPTEIAEILDVPPGTVRMRLHRGLAALRRLLPSATAALLVGLLPSRGMAAVRQAVLGEASGLAAVAFPVGSVASVTLGVLTMKYWLAFGCAVVLLGLWWWPEPSRAGGRGHRRGHHARAGVDRGAGARTRPGHVDDAAGGADGGDGHTEERAAVARPAAVAVAGAGRERRDRTGACAVHRCRRALRPGARRSLPASVPGAGPDPFRRRRTRHRRLLDDTCDVGIGRTLNLQFAPPEEVPFVAAERLHAQVLDASGAVVHQRVLRRAPISKPRQYDYYVTLPTGSYRVQAHTDGGLRFAMELQVAAEPMRREIEVPLVAR